MKKILIVEDEEDLQEIYKDILADYSLTITDNTETARFHLNQKMPDLMILDIILPKETGDTFLVRLKKDEKYKDLRVLCVTVLGDVGNQLRVIDDRIRCLAKPFTPKELRDKVKEMLELDGSR